MNNLSTEIKTHVILTFNKNKYFITDFQHEQIKLMGDNQKFNVEGETINTSTIAEIISIERFNSNKKEIYSNYDLPTHFTRILGSIKQEGARRSMINGLKKHFAGRETPKQAMEILKKIEAIKI